MALDPDGNLSFTGFIAKFEPVELDGFRKSPSDEGQSIPPTRAISPGGVFTTLGGGFAEKGIFVLLAAVGLVDRRFFPKELF